MTLGSDDYAVATEWTFTAAAIVVVALRISVRLLYHRSWPNKSDIWVLIGLLLNIVLVALYTWSSRLGGTGLANYVVTEQDEIILLKISYVSGVIWDIGLYMPKFSLLALYYDVILIVFRKLRMALHVITGFIVSAALVTICIDLFWCTPIPSNW
ncbi:hypothetical protein BP6252_11132 [Coleophoma cylindrospora]|uniref:Rhodopsin domain-containing protein n=1 Tax=Coleophoma cylindrospora TaxID=1849047 RepID=A0A3D8QP72_9HELO|nr:hypothetical protein BP6252_11132 [Coleophoma cylindrospora]